MEKEVSCINSRNLLVYVKEHAGGNCAELIAGLDPVLDGLPDPELFLMDPNNWISSALFSKMIKRAKEVFDDPRLPYKLGRYTVENYGLGYAQRIILKAFWSSQRALKNAQKLNDRWNRNKRIEVVKIGRSDATIRLHWNPRMEVSHDICLLNRGTYTFLPLIWGGKPLKLVEKCCFFHGSPYCEYHLRWTFRNRFHEIISQLFTSKTVLLDTIKEMEEGKEIIEQKYEEVQRLNLELSRKVKQLTAFQETGKAILSILNLEQVLNVIMNILLNVCSIHRAIIMLVDEKTGCLKFVHGVEADGREVPGEIQEYAVSLDRLNNILVRVTNTGRSEYVPDVRNSSLRKDNVILVYGNPRSVYVAPLITRSKVIGVIATDAVENCGIPVETRETLEIFAPQIAIAIENARLYRELQERMHALKRSHALLSRMEKFSFLGNLAARLAHEIKNPMTAIGTFIQLLPQKYGDEEFRKSFYNVAMEETERVNNLITELLDLVKKRESHFEIGDLHDLIEKMILLISPRSNSKEIKVETSFDPAVRTLWMDSEKIKQVVLNIISNAVDYTPPGGRIEVRTTLLNEKNDDPKVQVAIKDSGIGIPEENINKIFDPYFTTKHKSSMHNGTGLGLFIAHQNMQDHGGNIEVKSTPNAGTTFFLTLPYNARPDTNPLEKGE